MAEEVEKDGGDGNPGGTPTPDPKPLTPEEVAQLKTQLSEIESAKAKLEQEAAAAKSAAEQARLAAEEAQRARSAAPQGQAQFTEEQWQEMEKKYQIPRDQIVGVASLMRDFSDAQTPEILKDVAVEKLRSGLTERDKRIFAEFEKSGDFKKHLEENVLKQQRHDEKRLKQTFYTLKGSPLGDEIAKKIDIELVKERVAGGGGGNDTQTTIVGGQMDRGGNGGDPPKPQTKLTGDELEAVRNFRTTPERYAFFKRTGNIQKLVTEIRKQEEKENPIARNAADSEMFRMMRK